MTKVKDGIIRFQGKPIEPQIRKGVKPALDMTDKIIQSWRQKNVGDTQQENQNSP